MIGNQAKQGKKGILRKVTVLALENAMSSTATGPLDIFSLTGILWNKICSLPLQPYFDAKLVSVDGKKVTCLNQTELKPHCGINDVKKTDLIIISSTDLNSLERYKKLITPWLLKQFKQGSTLAAVCTGAFALAETGLLNGKKATTHWGFTNIFKQRYPQVNLKTELMITDEGRLLCGGGAHSYFDLCLYLVERYCGFQVAVECAKSLLLDMGRNSQAPYAVFEFQKQHGDLDILKAQNWIEKNFFKEIFIEEIASLVGMSERNFKRRFKQVIGDTPLHYLQTFRVEKAKRILEYGKKSVDEISAQVGYGDTAFFRQLFKKQVGMPPTHYRKKFAKT